MRKVAKNQGTGGVIRRAQAKEPESKEPTNRTEGNGVNQQNAAVQCGEELNEK